MGEFWGDGAPHLGLKMVGGPNLGTNGHWIRMFVTWFLRSEARLITTYRVLPKKTAIPWSTTTPQRSCPPPSPNSMLSSEFCVWRPSKETAIFCSWCSALPITTLKLGVAGVSKVSPCFHVDGRFFWRTRYHNCNGHTLHVRYLLRFIPARPSNLIKCVWFQCGICTWLVFTSRFSHIFTSHNSAHLLPETSFNDISWSNVSRCPCDPWGLDVDSQLCLVHFKGRPSPVEVPVRHLRGLAAPKERLFPTGRSTILMGNLWGINMDMYILM